MQPRDFMNQVVGEFAVEGRVVPVGRNGEAVVFEIPMGAFKIVAIANIPEDGRDSAPVYLKFKMPDNAVRRAQFSQSRRPIRKSIQEGSVADDFDGEYDEIDQAAI